ncbi:MAG: hypothetical protein N838_10225 [Thiohalocapsa sp. PB-PSB1]|nr:MAG: hypothetical protein N838_10225 [Thiohalocapsa sp. PB-PSB1]
MFSATKMVCTGQLSNQPARVGNAYRQVLRTDPQRRASIREPNQWHKVGTAIA